MYLTESLNQVIDPINKGLLPSQKIKIGNSLVNYVLKVEDFNTATKKIRNITSPQERFFLRIKALDTFNLSVRYKHAVYYLIDKRITDYKTKLQVFEHFGLGKYDLAFFNQIKEDNLMSIKFKSKLICEPITLPEDVTKECSEVLNRIDGYINRYVYKKLRFILTSNNLEPHDIINELKAKAVQTFFFSTLFMSPEHRLNLVKRSLVNHGTNLIYYYTTQAHGRLRNNKDGFENLCQSLTATNSSGQQYDDYNLSKSLYYSVDIVAQKHGIMSNDASSINSRLTVMKMMETYEGKQKKFIQLLCCMQDDKKFIDFFNRKWTNARNQFNSLDDIFDHIGDDYIECIKEYLGIDKKRAKMYIKDIKKDLAVA